MKKMHLLFGIFGFFPFINAQYFDNLNIGLKVGAELPKLTKIYPMLYREGYQDYTWKNPNKVGYYVGAFLNVKPGGNEKISLQPEIYYSNEKTVFDYTDTEGLEYQLQFKYAYFQINTIIQYYVVGGLNLGVGPQFGLAISKNNIQYESNSKDETNPDSQIQRELQEGLKGKSNFQMAFSLAYVFENGLAINTRYNLGLTDVISTAANDFGWTEQDNKLSTIQFGVSYAFGLPDQGP